MGAADANQTGIGRRIPPSLSSMRRNAVILLSTAIFATVVWLFTMTAGYPATLAAQASLAACVAACWTAWATRRKRIAPYIIALVGLLAMGAVIPDMRQMPSTYVLASISVILLWTGILLRPLANAGLAVASMLGLWVYGAEFVATPDQVDVPGQISISTLFGFMFVSLVLSGAMHYRDKLARERVEREIERLESEARGLAVELEGKVAELEVSREQLIQAQKLKTVGTMASGLAHELNNILTPIRGLAELIAQGATAEQSSRYGQRILDSAVAAAQITGALLTYTRQGTFQPVRSNARQLLQGQILPVLSNSLPRGVQLSFDLDRNVSIDVDRVLFQQCITNLVFNAVDAMPDGGEIHIGLTTSPVACTDDEMRHPSTDGGDRSAVITVSDTGTGIQAEHLDQIFDPFFTTKPVGSGTGLGLAMVQGTVSRHEGRVLVDTAPGKGTKFTIMLPLAPSEEKSDSPSWPVLGGERVGPVVLVVTEDEDALDEYEELLEITECSPICTGDVRGAATMITEMGDKLDLLVLDWQVTGVSAEKMFRTVRELFPDLPVIIVSDVPTDPTVQRVIGSGPTRSVRKPMDPQLFATLMTDLLLPATGYARDFTPVPINPSFSDSGPHPKARSGS